MCIQVAFYQQLWINTWSSKFEQRTDSILLIPRDTDHKDPKKIDLNVPLHAQYLHNAWKRHQDAVYWTDINLAIENRSTFYQTGSNAIILQKTLPACCIRKVVRMKTGEVPFEKVYMWPRRPSKISLKHEWKKELGSEHAQRPEVGQLSRSFQTNQPTPNPVRERSERFDIMQDGRKRPVLRRSMLILFAKNLVLQSERCDLLRQM